MSVVVVTGDVLANIVDAVLAPAAAADEGISTMDSGGDLAMAEVMEKICFRSIGGGFLPSGGAGNSGTGSSGGGHGPACSDGGLGPFVATDGAGVEVLALAAVPQVLPCSPGKYTAWVAAVHGGIGPEDRMTGIKVFLQARVMELSATDDG